ncbi:hypothetical protein BDN70DRAFT_899604 [Pholiota conissans]|uniref:Uncharacterized protein n=1 Tax=Pholiota conissans TaxID=109636 RepID=A0A9P5YRZ9_9AGAR|nr:hypothetical protein BDN70DRAFT_899604 [Pholiota conissans]
MSNVSFATFRRPKIAFAGPRSHQRQTLRRLLADPSSLRNHSLAAVNLQRIYQASRSPSSRRCFTPVGVDTRYVCRFEPRERVGRTDNGYTGLKPTTRLAALRAFYVTDYTVQSLVVSTDRLRAPKRGYDANKRGEGIRPSTPRPIVVAGTNDILWVAMGMRGRTRRDGMGLSEMRVRTDDENAKRMDVEGSAYSGFEGSCMRGAGGGLPHALLGTTVFAASVDVEMLYMRLDERKSEYVRHDARGKWRSGYIILYAPVRWRRSVVPVLYGEFFVREDIRVREDEGEGKGLGHGKRGAEKAWAVYDAFAGRRSMCVVFDEVDYGPWSLSWSLSCYFVEPAS